MMVHSKHWMAAALVFALALPSVTLAALDEDGDGVADEKDECPQTPAKTAVDKHGCPLKDDQDHDGVADAMDDCPATVPGSVVDAHGCALDEDGDGVPDGVDQCPHTAKGISVDAKGCPLEKALKAKTAVVAKKHAPRVNVPPPPMPPAAEPASGLPADPAHPAPVTTAMAMPEPIKPVALPKYVEPAAAVAAPKSEPVAEAKQVAAASPAEPIAKPTLRQALSKLSIAPPEKPVAKPKAVPVVQDAQGPQASGAVQAASVTVALETPSPTPVAKPADVPAPQTESKPVPVPVPVPAAEAEAVAPVQQAKPASLANAEMAPPPAELPRFVVINFVAGSASLNEASLRKLNELAAGLTAKSSAKLQIKAHANSQKDGRWPDDLAQKRADIVRVYLNAQNIAKDRMTISARAEVSASAEDERDSRRVDIEVE